jgi:hypothetical protein
LLYAFPFFWLWIAAPGRGARDRVGPQRGTGHDVARRPLFLELFATRVPLQRASLVYQLLRLLGGLAPFIATLLLDCTDRMRWHMAGSRAHGGGDLFAPETHRVKSDDLSTRRIRRQAGRRVRRHRPRHEQRGLADALVLGGINVAQRDIDARHGQLGGR